MTDAATIAAGLTEAQKAALVYIRPHSIIARYKFDYSDLFGLERLGLVTFQNDIFVSITPIGLEVRKILESGK